MGNLHARKENPPKYCKVDTNSCSGLDAEMLAFMDVVTTLLALPPSELATASTRVQHWFISLQQLSRVVYPGYELRWTCVTPYLLLIKHLKSPYPLLVERARPFLNKLELDIA